MSARHFNLGKSVTAALALALSAGAFAQTAPTASRADAKFVNDAAMSGVAEVKLSEIAQRNASAPEVKQYADRMVKDHQTANQELMQITSGKGMQAPTDMGSAHKKMAAKLGSAKGPDFDQQYMKGMLADHQKVVALFKKEADSGSDPELKAFAAKQLPGLTEHLQMAQAMQGGASAKGAQGRMESGMQGGTKGTAQGAADGTTTPTSTDWHAVPRSGAGTASSGSGSGSMQR